MVRSHPSTRLALALAWAFGWLEGGWAAADEPRRPAAPSPLPPPAADPGGSTQQLYRELMQWLPGGASGGAGTSKRRVDRVLAAPKWRRPLRGNVPYLAPEPTLRLKPGSPFNPGATGPGVVSMNDRVPFLGGTFDPRSGWPLAILDHFKPDPERVGPFWIVSTYYCPQEMTPGRADAVRLRQFDPKGGLVNRTPAALHRDIAAQDRPVFIQVHGSLTYADTAIGSGLWSHTWLQLNGALPDNALFLIFDWPSWRVSRVDPIDADEKGRRAYVAGLHLAEFLSGFPPNARVCLFGQSYGGRATLSALHLLAGGVLDAQDGTPAVRIARPRRDLQLRAVCLATAVDRDWLLPDKKLDRALWNCQGLLNLYNPGDSALLLYPFLRRSGHRPALGRPGMTATQIEALGPLANRIAQRDVSERLGRSHTLLDATSDQEIAGWIAPYTWAPGPGR